MNKVLFDVSNLIIACEIGDLTDLYATWCWFLAAHLSGMARTRVPLNMYIHTYTHTYRHTLYTNINIIIIIIIIIIMTIQFPFASSTIYQFIILKPS